MNQQPCFACKSPFWSYSVPLLLSVEVARAGDHTNAYIAWKCLKAVRHTFTSSLCLTGLLVRHPQWHSSPNVGNKGGFPLGLTVWSSCLWFGLFPVAFCNMGLIAPISNVICTFQRANACFSESRNTVSILGLSQYAAGTHSSFCGLLGCSLMAGFGRWGLVSDLWVVGGQSTCVMSIFMTKCHWRGNFTKLVTLRLLQWMPLLL